MAEPSHQKIKYRFYQRCSKAELATFCHNRGVEVTKKNGEKMKRPDKKDYIRVLQQADLNQTFPFLELSPEMRNAVYRELLIKGKSTCNPKILETSRQVCYEGTGILYRVNPTDVVVSYTCTFTQGYFTLSTYNAKERARKLVHDGRSPDITWPYRLRCARMVFFQLDPPRVENLATATQTRDAVRQIIRSMCDTLSRGHCVTSVCLILGRLLEPDVEWADQQSYFNTTMRPLLGLGSGVKINVHVDHMCLTLDGRRKNVESTNDPATNQASLEIEQQSASCENCARP